MSEKIRIQKYLSEQGIMSRREAETAIENGWVLVNGSPAKEPGIKINPETDIVTIASEAQKNIAEKITVVVYKPRGYVSSKDTENKNIFNVFPIFKHLNTVGRLDKESDGLILLSNDGLITKAITGSDHLTEKEYVVVVREDVFPWMIEKMKSGIKLADGMTLPAVAEKIDRHTFRITIREGRNHQIRRMADHLKLTIQSLTRVRIGSIETGNLKPGQFRKLTNNEIDELKSVLK
ncbi:MAG: rRNA pseudouridine synthase [Candidatus Nomurabacteria bacterium]|nr:rRNA pseudouridine synthase [Candidatus Nomurabacteria bacterium]